VIPRKLQNVVYIKKIDVKNKGKKGAIIGSCPEKGLPLWKLAYSFSVYIILPESTQQYLFTAADNSPWNIFHSRFAIFRGHF
jgi:hypothetical protein